MKFLSKYFESTHPRKTASIKSMKSWRIYHILHKLIEKGNSSMFKRGTKAWVIISQLNRRIIQLLKRKLDNVRYSNIWTNHYHSTRNDRTSRFTKTLPQQTTWQNHHNSRAPPLLLIQTPKPKNQTIRIFTHKRLKIPRSRHS